MLRNVHLRQLRFVGDSIGVTASDDELRASYREGLGVAYRLVALRPYYLHRGALRPGLYRDRREPSAGNWATNRSDTRSIASTKRRSRPPSCEPTASIPCAAFGSVDCMSRLSRTSTKSNSKSSSGAWGWSPRSTQARVRNRHGRASQILASTSVRLRRPAAPRHRCFSSVTIQRTMSVDLRRWGC